MHLIINLKRGSLSIIEMDGRLHRSNQVALSSRMGEFLLIVAIRKNGKIEVRNDAS